MRAIKIENWEIRIVVEQKLSNITFKVQNSGNVTFKVVHHDKLKPY